jgi:integrase/recombinase XerD
MWTGVVDRSWCAERASGWSAFHFPLMSGTPWLAMSNEVDHAESIPRCFYGAVAPHGPLTPSAIKVVVRAACDRSGLPSLGAHRLRHTVASELLRYGAGLLEIGQVLRHRSIASTAIYAKVDTEALRQLARPWPGSAA